MANSEVNLDLIDFGETGNGAPLIPPTIPLYQSEPVEERPVPVDRLRKFEEFIEEPIDGETKPKYWSVEFFKPFFDVTTEVILHRLLLALQPFSASDFFSGSLPDLYAPFWLATTLICVLTVSGNAASYLTLGAEHFSANLSLLVSCATLVYGIIATVPVGIYCMLKHESSEVRYLPLLSLYGYSLLPFLPASLLSSLSPYLKWPAMLLATTWSFLLLRANYATELFSQPVSKRYTVLGLLFAGYCVLVLVVNLDYLIVKAAGSEEESIPEVEDVSDSNGGGP